MLVKRSEVHLATAPFYFKRKGNNLLFWSEIGLMQCPVIHKDVFFGYNFRATAVNCVCAERAGAS